MDGTLKAFLIIVAVIISLPITLPVLIFIFGLLCELVIGFGTALFLVLGWILEMLISLVSGTVWLIATLFLAFCGALGSIPDNFERMPKAVRLSIVAVGVLTIVAVLAFFFGK